MLAPFRFMLSLALTLGIAAPAMADPPLVPPACKLRGAKRITIANFHFTKTDLETYRTQNVILPPMKKRCPPGSNRRRATLTDVLQPGNPSGGKTQRNTPDTNTVAWCGIVDNWLYAAKNAYEYCNKSTLGNGNAYFVVTAPSTFNDTDHHHDLYTTYDDGLTGSCYVCTDVRSTGTATAPKDQIKLPTPAKGD